MSERKKTWSQKRREKAGSARRPGEPKAIPALYAFLSCIEGDEGIVASMTPMGVTPLVASKKAEVAMMKTMARRVADGTGHPVRVVRFDRGREVEQIEPDPRSPVKGQFRELGPEMFGDDRRGGPDLDEIARTLAERGIDAVEASTLGMSATDAGVLIDFGPPSEGQRMMLLSPGEARRFAAELIAHAKRVDEGRGDA